MVHPPLPQPVIARTGTSEPLQRSTPEPRTPAGPRLASSRSVRRDRSGPGLGLPGLGGRLDGSGRGRSSPVGWLPSPSAELGSSAWGLLRGTWQLVQAWITECSVPHRRPGLPAGKDVAGKFAHSLRPAPAAASPGFRRRAGPGDPIGIDIATLAGEAGRGPGRAWSRAAGRSPGKPLLGPCPGGATVAESIRSRETAEGPRHPAVGSGERAPGRRPRGRSGQEGDPGRDAPWRSRGPRPRAVASSRLGIDSTGRPRAASVVLPSAGSAGERSSGSWHAGRWPRGP